MKASYLVFLPVILCSAQADTVSFAGNLRTDANVVACGGGCILNSSNSDGDYAQWAAVVDSFNVGSTSTMRAITFSYGGGVNAAAQAIAQGGFEPYLSLFDASGSFIASTFFGTTCPTGANTNTLSGQCYDVLLDGGILSPGAYQIAISAFENLSLAENLGTGTLADGFTGLGNLQDGEDLHYAFDVILNSTTPVPEPRPTYLLLSVALLLVLVRRCGKTLEKSR